MMVLEELYEKYRQMITDGILRWNIFSYDQGQRVEAEILALLGLDEWEIANCVMSCDYQGLHIAGFCNYMGHQDCAGSIQIEEEQGLFYARASVTLRGEVVLGQLFKNRQSRIAEGIRKEILDSGAGLPNRPGDETASWEQLILVNPQILLDTRNRSEPYQLALNSELRFPESFDRYAVFLNGIHNLSGGVRLGGAAQYDLVAGDPKERNGFRLHICQPEGNLEAQMEVMIDRHIEALDKELAFRFPLTSWNRYFWMSAGIKPALTGGDIAALAASILGVRQIPDQSLLLKVIPGFQTFGIEGIAFGIDQSQNRQGIGPVCDTAVLLGLTRPVRLLFPWLTLNRFSLNLNATKNSWLKNKTELDYYFSAELILEAEAALFASYNLKTCFYARLPEGLLSARLSFEDRQKAPGTEEFFASMGAGTMGKNLAIAAITVEIPLEEDSVDLTVDIQDLWKVNAGSLEFAIQAIQLYYHRDVSDYHVSLNGEMRLNLAGRTAYFLIAADYMNESWKFSGRMSGRLPLIALAAALFGREVSVEDARRLELTGLTLCFTSREHTDFSIQASVVSAWQISLFHQEISLYGEVQYGREGGVVNSCLTAGLKIGVFSLILSAKNFDQMFREYIFRIQIQKAYLQADYQRIPVSGESDDSDAEEYEEILTVQMGGMTLLDMTEYLIGLFNPNQSVSLGPPWDTLLDISLDRFQLRFNITRKEISFLYRAGLDLLGLVQIDQVGLTYQSAGQKVEFILTGKLLDQTYTLDDPIRWNALEEEPPQLPGRGDGYFKLYYLGMGAHVRVDGMDTADSIPEALRLLEASLDQPQGNRPVVMFDQQSGWLFGAKFTALDSLQLGLVLCDPDLYGLFLEIRRSKEGSVLDSFAGFYMELLYKKISDTTGMFRAVIEMPEAYRTFQLGVCSFTLGVMSLEIYTNGNFLLDLGFPHSRNFEKSFQIQAGIYTGHGGFYLGVLESETTSLVPRVTSGTFTSVVALGVGLSIGLGRSFDFGIVAGGVSLEAVGIFEGVLAVYKSHDLTVNALYFKVTAVAGIVGKLFIRVDFKIICISASVEIRAFATVDFESCQPMRIGLSLSLAVSATIKILFIKIHFSFHFSYDCQFTIGGASQAPWTLEDGTNRMSREARKRQRPMPRAGKRVGWDSFKVRERAELNLTVVPVFSRVEEEEAYACMGWMSVLPQDTDFRTLLIRVSEWILWQLTEDGGFFKENLAVLKEGGLPEYQEIERFVRENLLFCVKLCTEGENVDGVFFPMTPYLELTVASGGRTVKAEDYSTCNPVSESYIQIIRKYFEQWMMQAAQTPELRSADAAIPIQQFFLTEYVQCLIKGLLAGMEECLKNWEDNVNGLTFYELCRIYCGPGAEREDILKLASKVVRANPTLTFPGGVSLRAQHWIGITKNKESLAQVAERYKVSRFPHISEFLRKLWLLHYPLELSITGYRTVNLPKVSSGEVMAAVFFVRYYGESVDLDRRPYKEALSKEHPLETDFVKEDLNPLLFHIPVKGREVEYQALYGDTLERMAGVAAVLNLEVGQMSEWDHFLSEFMMLNPGTADGRRQAGFEIPPGTIRLVHRYDLYQLSLLLFPDRGIYLEEESPLYTAGILESGQELDLYDAEFSAETGAGEPYTLEGFMERYDMGADELADLLSVVVFTGPVRIPDAPWVPEPEFEEEFYKTEGFKRTGPMVSRVFMQGLRLPREEGNGTLALFQMLEQMMPIQENQEYQIILSALDPVMKVEAEAVKISRELIADHMPAAVFEPHYLEKPSQAPDFGTALNVYNIKQTLSLRHGQVKEDGQLSTSMVLQIPGKDFLADAKKLAKQNSKNSYQVWQGNSRPEIRWGTFCFLRVKKAGNNCYELDSMGQEYQEVLKSALTFGQLDCHLYCPSGTDHPVYLEDHLLAGQAYLVRTNSMKETAPVRENSGPAYTAAWNDPGMMRLLWEFASVQAGGYYLYLSQELPESCFITEQTITLLLLILPANEQTVFSCGYNCYLRGVTAGEAPDYITGDGSDEGHLRTVCLKEAGHDRFYFALEDGAEMDFGEENDHEWLARNLYQVAAYQLEAEGGFRASNVSYPLLSVQKQVQGKNCAWYEADLPLYRYEGNGGNLYGLIGKEAVLQIRFRDLFGNGYRPLNQVLHLVQRYHDALFKLEESGYLEASYRLEKSGETIRLVMAVRETSGEKLAQESHLLESGEKRREALRKLAAVRNQYQDPQVEFRFLHTLLSDAQKLGKDGLLERMQEIEARLLYLDEHCHFEEYSGNTLDEILIRYQLTPRWLSGILENRLLEELFIQAPLRNMTFGEAAILRRQSIEALVDDWRQLRLVDGFSCTDDQKFGLDQEEGRGSGWIPYADMPYLDTGYRMDELEGFELPVHERMTGLFREGAVAVWRGHRLRIQGNPCLLQLEEYFLSQEEEAQSQEIRDALISQRILGKSPRYLKCISQWEQEFPIERSFLSGKTKLFALNGQLEIIRKGIINDPDYPMEIRRILYPCEMRNPAGDFLLLEEIKGFHILKRGMDEAEYMGLFMPESSISIRSYVDQGYQKPYFYALRPLCRKLITRPVSVKRFEDYEAFGSGGSEGHLENFTDIDIEVWADTFLRDVDWLLSQSEFISYSGADRQMLEGILRSRDMLVREILGQLRPIERHRGIEVPDTVYSLWEARLQQSLSEGYGFQAAIQYEAENHLAEDYRVSFRLGEGEKTASDGFSCLYVPGKLRKGQQEFAVLVKAAGQEQSSAKLPEYGNVKWIESDITVEMEGYESAVWQNFLKSFGDSDEAQLQLQGEIPVPLPLRKYPQKPILNRQEGTGTTPFSLERWDYHLRMTIRPVAQDEIKVTFYFAEPLNLRSGEADLFDCLARYETVREELKERLKQNGGRAAAMAVYAECIQEIASHWKVLEDPAPIRNDLEKSVRSVLDFQFHYMGNGTLIRVVEEEQLPREAELSLLYYAPDGSSYSFEKREEGVWLSGESYPEADSNSQIEIVVGGIHLSDHWKARSSATVTRNENLFGDDSRLQVREDFIYRCQPQEFVDYAYPLLRRPEELVWPALRLGENGISGAGHRLMELIKEQGVLYQDEKFRFQLEIRFTYLISEESQLNTSLPVLYLPLSFCNGERVREVEETLDRLLSEYPMNALDAAFKLRMALERENHIFLQLENVKVPIVIR